MSAIVMAGLDPAIHAFRVERLLRRGCPGHKGVHARLRRAMPGHDGARCGADAHRAGNFSVARLMEFPTALGQDARITVKPTKKRRGEMEVVG